MKNKDAIILEKILSYCRQMKEACDLFGNDYGTFVENSVFKNACCMCILQIGELCKLISCELRNQEKAVPWRAWCGIRDVFAHQYDNLDYQSAWDTIQNDLPLLKAEIERIQNKESQEAGG